MKEKAFVKNASDEHQIKEAEQKEKRRRERELNDVREVLSTRAGRRFMWRYLSHCQIFSLSFTGNSQTFFNEGKREVGLSLLADVNEASPESYLLMMNEAKGD